MYPLPFSTVKVFWYFFAMVHWRIHMGLFVGSCEFAVEKGGDRNISIQNGSETKERYV
jgi:hypothetical protein